MAQAPRTIPHRNRSPFGWWIASYLLRFEFEDEDRQDETRRCLAWENTIVLKANDRERAYERAVEIGRRGGGQRGWNEAGRRGRWRFEGLTSLLPIYDELGDGAEVLWQEFQGVSLRKVRSRVRPKRTLEVFDDSSDGCELNRANMPLQPLQPTRAAKPRGQRKRRVPARAAERQR
jgi:hypothetical protein